MFDQDPYKPSPYRDNDYYVICLPFDPAYMNVLKDFSFLSWKPIPRGLLA